MRIHFEKVPDSEGSSFGCFQAGGQVFDCPYHIHPEVEILHVISGKGLLVVGDHIGRFSPGELLVLGSGLPHLLCSDAPPSETSEPTLIRYVQFKCENFGDAFWAMPEQRSTAHLLATAARGLRLDAATAESVMPALDNVWSANGSRRLWRLMEVLDLVSNSPAIESLASVGYAPVQTHRDSERLNRAIQYVHNHLTTEITLNDVAERAGMSPPAFSRFFHRFVGVPFIEYVVGLRISLACRYLLETDKTVASICYLCGFNNLSNFNRQFLRSKGVTPREYRRNATLDGHERVLTAAAIPGGDGALMPETRFS